MFKHVFTPFKPGICHQAQSLNLPFTFLCIHFDLYIYPKIRIKLNNESYDNLPLDLKLVKAKIDIPDFVELKNYNYYSSLINKILFERKFKKQGYEIIIKSIFMDLVSNIFRQLNDIVKMKVFPETVEKMIDLIKANYHKKLSLDWFAEKIHLHPVYISNLFKKHIGSNITEFINEYRIGVARGMLIKTNQSINNIALSTGYYDIHHFSRNFKQLEGISPGQYRKIKQK